MKIVKKFQMKIAIFTAMKNRCILHGRVFVMIASVFSDICQYTKPCYVKTAEHFF